MPKYIDAEKLFVGTNLSHRMTDEDATFVQKILDVINNATAEDVEPVRHAHWIEKNNPAFSPFDGSAPYIFYCSHCGKTDGDKYHFCHVCGFKMDEEA